MGSGISRDGLECGPLVTLAQHQGGINCMAMSEDGSLLVTGSDDRTVRMWSTKTEAIECLDVLQGHTSFIQCVAIHDTYVVTGSKDATLRKWDMATAQCDFIYQGHEGRVNSILCTGEFIFSASHDKTARAWLFDTHDVQDPEDASIRTFQGHTGVVSAIIFLPGQDSCLQDELGFNINPADLLITASFDNTARIWSFDSGQCLKTLKGHKRPILCMDTDPRGNILYTAGEDKTVIAWDIVLGRMMKAVEGAHEGPVLSLRVANRLLYTSSTDRTAKCWVRHGLQNTRTYANHTDTVVSLKFHHGILFTVCNDGLVRAFDAKSGSLRRRFRGHESAVTCLGLCELEGRLSTRLFTAGNDSTLRIWDATNLGEDCPPPPPIGPDPDYDLRQSQRLDELDQHLDHYVATCGVSVAQETASGPVVQETTSGPTEGDGGSSRKVESPSVDILAHD